MTSKIQFVEAENTTREYPNAFIVDEAMFKVNGEYVCVEPCGGKGHLLGDQYIYVSSTGDDDSEEGLDNDPFLTIANAMNYINSFVTIAGDVFIVFQDEGPFYINETIIINHPNNISYIGVDNITETTITYCESSDPQECGDDIIFDVSSYITIKDIIFNTEMLLIRLFDPKETAVINMNNVTIQDNIDASVDGFTNLIIDDLTIDAIKTVSFTNIVSIDAIGITVNTDTQYIDDGGFVINIDKSNIPEIEANINVSVNKTDSKLIYPVNISNSYVGKLTVNSIAEYYIPNIYTKVFAGWSRSFTIKTDGTMWATGVGDIGEFGDGNENSYAEFTQIGTDNDWDHISSGKNHSIAIKTDGTMWATGSNSNGQLGIGGGTDEWEQVFGNNWLKSACGENCSLAITTDGELWGCGEGAYIGINSTNNVTEWEPISSGIEQGIGGGWLDIAHGGHHAIGLFEDLNESIAVMTTGSNSNGQLGIGDWVDRPTFHPVAWGSFQYVAASLSASVISINTNYYSCGQGSITATNTYDDINVFTVAVSSGGFNILSQPSGGSYHFAVLESNNSSNDIQTTGHNDNGQLGNNTIGGFQIVLDQEFTNDENWISVASGYDHTIALKSDGSIWGTGYNNNGELGLGSEINNFQVFTQTGV